MMHLMNTNTEWLNQTRESSEYSRASSARRTELPLVADWFIWVHLQPLLDADDPLLMLKIEALLQKIFVN